MSIFRFSGRTKRGPYCAIVGICLFISYFFVPVLTNAWLHSSQLVAGSSLWSVVNYGSIMCFLVPHYFIWTASARRAHDFNRTAWLGLLGLLIFPCLIFAIIPSAPTTMEENA